MNRKKIFISLILLCAVIFLASFHSKEENKYRQYYLSGLDNLISEQKNVLNNLKEGNFYSDVGQQTIKKNIESARLKLKSIDFWLRYLHPAPYRKINGQLPVEWEVDEKYERPQRRLGAGLSLVQQRIATGIFAGAGAYSTHELVNLMTVSIDSMEVYKADSVINILNKPDHFFFANRLFLLNLTSIYTTGFECPDADRIIPELLSMMKDVKKIYEVFDESFPKNKIRKDYLTLYDKAIQFVISQPTINEKFDHFIFIRDFINPLFTINREMILENKAVSHNLFDLYYNNNAKSIFSKPFFEAQSTKGVYWTINDEKILNEIKQTGKLLFYDPIISGNLKRSCASCHKPTEYFTDTTIKTSLKFDGINSLSRNTPSLVNVVYNHLLMLDGRHNTLLIQGKDVTTHKEEMSSNNYEIVTRVLSCNEYSKAFTKFAALTSQKKISIEHILSAVIFYYSGFSYNESPFDEAINNKKTLATEETKGFNIFMSKARCGTCHYAPEFNGVKPPFIDNEFEVLGTPADKETTLLSSDNGRYGVFPERADEMLFAFRTPTIRNSEHTKPYFHNGVFNTLKEVIDFYDAGGGRGHGLNVATQTLPPDSLRLTDDEKKEIISFINSTTEKIKFENPPANLPLSSDAELNKRIVGGEY